MNHFKKIAILAGFFAGATTAFAQTSGGCTIAGPNNAKLTIEEYADFECPYCARGANTMKQVLKDYKGKVRLVYRNMPLSSHPDALVAAKAFSAVCLQDPSLAGTFANEIFANQDEFRKKGEPYLYEVAQKIGVDIDKLKTDMNGPEVAKALEADKQAAHSHSFQGTPSFLIGTESVTGALPYTDFKQVIDRQLGN